MGIFVAAVNDRPTNWSTNNRPTVYYMFVFVFDAIVCGCLRLRKTFSSGCLAPHVCCCGFAASAKRRLLFCPLANTFGRFENGLSLFARSFIDKPIFRAASHSPAISSWHERMRSTIYIVCVCVNSCQMDTECVYIWWVGWLLLEAVTWWHCT